MWVHVQMSIPIPLQVAKNSTGTTIRMVLLLAIGSDYVCDLFHMSNRHGVNEGIREDYFFLVLDSVEKN